MQVSNRLYNITIVLVIIAIILAGIWIYKQLKGFINETYNYKSEDIIEERVQNEKTQNQEINVNKSYDGIDKIRNDKSIIY